MGDLDGARSKPPMQRTNSSSSSSSSSSKPPRREGVRGPLPTSWAELRKEADADSHMRRRSRSPRGERRGGSRRTPRGREGQSAESTAVTLMAEQSPGHLVSAGSPAMYASHASPQHFGRRRYLRRPPLADSPEALRRAPARPCGGWAASPGSRSTCDRAALAAPPGSRGSRSPAARPHGRLRRSALSQVGTDNGAEAQTLLRGHWRVVRARAWEGRRGGRMQRPRGRRTSKRERCPGKGSAPSVQRNHRSTAQL